MAFTTGALVKYTNPECDREADMRFVVIEDRGDRVLVGLVDAIGLGSQECFAAFNYEAA